MTREGQEDGVRERKGDGWNEEDEREIFVTGASKAAMETKTRQDHLSPPTSSPPATAVLMSDYENLYVKG